MWQMAAFQAIGMVGGMVGANTAAHAAKDAARTQAHDFRRQALARLEKMKYEHQQLRGRQIAGVYASGIDMSGTAVTNLNQQNKMMKADRDDLKQHAEAGFKAIKKGAQMQFNAAQWQAASQGVSAIGKAFSAFGGFNNSNTVGGVQGSGIQGGGAFSSGNTANSSYNPFGASDQFTINR